MTIPESVTNIGDYAFYGCSALNEVNYGGSEEDWIAISIGSENSYLTEAYGLTAYGTCGEALTWTIRNNVFKITGTGDMPDYSYSSVPWRRYSSSITSVVIEDGVANIGDYAFDGCSGLTSVDIPDSVMSIGDYAFCGCSGLTSVTMPDGVTNIGDFAFINCSGLTSVTIDNSVTSIGESAFYNCSGLTSVTIPESVTSIGEFAFYDCSGLTSVTIGDSVTSIGDYAFADCSSLTSVDIPDSVTSIGEGAFDGCSALVTVNYSGSIEDWNAISIGYGNEYLTAAYFACAEISASGSCGDNLTWALEDEVLTISGTGNMKDYSSYSNVPWYSYRTNIASIIIADGVTSIGDYAFSGCSRLTNVAIPNSVTCIGDYAFCYCSGLTSIDIPYSVTSIGSGAFSGCIGLSTVNYGGSDEDWNEISIGEDNDYLTAAYSGSVITWTLENGVMTISGTGDMPDYSYAAPPWYSYRTSITSIVIEDSVTSVGSYAFSECSSLIRVDIPDSVTSIGDGAFYDCGSLSSADIPDGVTSIGKSAFSGCSVLTCVDIPDSVTSIGDGAFYYCDSLTSVTMGDSVEYIDNWAFAWCTALTSVEMPNSVTYIGDYAFYHCESLLEANIGNSVEYIGEWAFYNCSSLTSMTIPDSVEYIEDYAFYSCKNMTSLTTGSGVKYIGDYAFAYCDNISVTELVMPEGLIFIGDDAFFRSSKISSVRIEQYTGIGCGAFNGTTTIYGYNGSVAERYAETEGNTFVSIGVMSTETDVVEVTNSQELFEALRPYRTIILADGVYEMDNRLPLSAMNLTLKAENSEIAEILSWSTDTPVVQISYSENIEIDGIIMGHFTLPGEGEGCPDDGYVIYAYASDTIRVSDSDLYGCGVIGVYCEDVSDFTAESCVIRDCRDQIIKFYNSNGEFIDCVMSGNAYDESAAGKYAAVELENGDISFSNGVFANNHNTEFTTSNVSIINDADEADTTGDYMILSDCVFSDNTWDGGTPQNYGMCLNGITWCVENETLYLGYDIELEDGSVITSELGEVLPYSSSSLPWKKLTYSSIELANGIIYDTDTDTDTDPVLTTPVITDCWAEYLFDYDVVGVYVDIDNFTSGQVLAVGYSNGVLTSISETDEDGYAELTANTETVKVFIWDSLNSMIPLCEAATAAVE